VTPRSSRSELCPGTEAHFAARLHAPPVDGAANAALIELVAKAFGVPRRAVTLVGGETARLKRLHVKGDVVTLAKCAASLYGARP
jgi:uncharacterized protein YggU (UPF0235/DUF167 family)